MVAVLLFWDTNMAAVIMRKRKLKIRKLIVIIMIMVIIIIIIFTWILARKSCIFNYNNKNNDHKKKKQKKFLFKINFPQDDSLVLMSSTSSPRTSMVDVKLVLTHFYFYSSAIFITLRRNRDTQHNSVKTDFFHCFLLPSVYIPFWNSPQSCLKNRRKCI